MRVRALLPLLLAALPLGCINEVQPQLDELRALIDKQNAELARLRTELTDGLTLALCSPELRQLLEDVQRECSQLPEVAADATATPPAIPAVPAVPAVVDAAADPTAVPTPAAPLPAAVGQCTTKQIRPAVIAADPEHRGRFLKLMSHLPHEVLYLAEGATEVAPYRRERLIRLARRAVLSSTVFLVVSSPQAGDVEAVRRAELVEKMLLELRVPPAKIRRWLYAFPANKQDIDRGADQPGLAESKDLFRGVWIFRADC